MWCCPNCQSRNYKVKNGSHSNGTHCDNCGYDTPPIVSTPIQASEGNQITLDMGFEESVKPSKTIENCSTDWQKSSVDLSDELFGEKSDFHDTAYKFKVLKGKVDWPRQKGFSNVQRSVFEGCKVMFTSDRWLVIFRAGRNKIETRFLPEVERQRKAELAKIADDISIKYSLAIDEQPVHFSKWKPEVKTPYLWEGRFSDSESKSVYSKPNLPGQLELSGNNCVPNTLNLTQALVMLNKNTLLDIEATKLEIYNKHLHQSVLVDMKDALKNINSRLGRDDVVISVKEKTSVGMSASSLSISEKLEAVLEKTGPLVLRLNEVFMVKELKKA